MKIFLSKNVNGTTNSEDIQFNFFNLFEKEQKLGGILKILSAPYRYFQ